MQEYTSLFNELTTALKSYEIRLCTVSQSFQARYQIVSRFIEVFYVIDAHCQEYNVDAEDDYTYETYLNQLHHARMEAKDQLYYTYLRCVGQQVLRPHNNTEHII